MRQDRLGQGPDTDQNGRHDSPQDVLDRLTVSQAADRLGVTQDAVRKRIARGTIRHHKDHEGRIFVYLDTFESESKTDQDANQDKYTRSLEDQIDFLRRELERKDTIIMALSQRIPELEGSPEPREDHMTDSEETAKDKVSPEQQESSQRRSWWRAFFRLE